MKDSLLTAEQLFPPVLYPPLPIHAVDEHEGDRELVLSRAQALFGEDFCKFLTRVSLPDRYIGAVLREKLVSGCENGVLETVKCTVALGAKVSAVVVQLTLHKGHEAIYRFLIEELPAVNGQVFDTRAIEGMATLGDREVKFLERVRGHNDVLLELSKTLTREELFHYALRTSAERPEVAVGRRSRI